MPALLGRCFSNVTLTQSQDHSNSLLTIDIEDAAAPNNVRPTLKLNISSVLPHRLCCSVYTAKYAKGLKKSSPRQLSCWGGQGAGSQRQRNSSRGDCGEEAATRTKNRGSERLAQSFIDPCRHDGEASQKTM